MIHAASVLEQKKSFMKKHEVFPLKEKISSRETLYANKTKIVFFPQKYDEIAAFSFIEIIETQTS